MFKYYLFKSNLKLFNTYEYFIIITDSGGIIIAVVVGVSPEAHGELEQLVDGVAPGLARLRRRRARAHHAVALVLQGAQVATLALYVHHLVMVDIKVIWN